MKKGLHYLTKGIHSRHTGWILASRNLANLNEGYPSTPSALRSGGLQGQSTNFMQAIKNDKHQIMDDQPDDDEDKGREIVSKLLLNPSKDELTNAN